MDSGGEKGKEGPHSEEENTKKLGLEFGVGRGAGISAIIPEEAGRGRSSKADYAGMTSHFSLHEYIERD